jgi:hypothetical protein
VTIPSHSLETLPTDPKLDRSITEYMATLICSSFVHIRIWRLVEIRRIQHPVSRFAQLVICILSQDEQVRIGLDLDKLLGQIRVRPDAMAHAIGSSLDHRHILCRLWSVEIRRMRRTTGESRHILSTVFASLVVAVAGRSENRAQKLVSVFGLFHRRYRCCQLEKT